MFSLFSPNKKSSSVKNDPPSKETKEEVDALPTELLQATSNSSGSLLTQDGLELLSFLNEQVKALNEIAPNEYEELKCALNSVTEILPNINTSDLAKKEKLLTYAGYIKQLEDQLGWKPEYFCPTFSDPRLIPIYSAIAEKLKTIDVSKLTNLSGLLNTKIFLSFGINASAKDFFVFARESFLLHARYFKLLHMDVSSEKKITPEDTKQTGEQLARLLKLLEQSKEYSYGVKSATEKEYSFKTQGRSTTKMYCIKELQEKLNEKIGGKSKKPSADSLFDCLLLTEKALATVLKYTFKNKFCGLGESYFTYIGPIFNILADLLEGEAQSNLKFSGAQSRARVDLEVIPPNRERQNVSPESSDQSVENTSWRCFQ